MTAETFIENQCIENDLRDTIKDLGDLIPLLMIAFAKHHCEEQVKAIEEKATCDSEYNELRDENNYKVDKDSIRNAYDLSNIK